MRRFRTALDRLRDRRLGGIPGLVYLPWCGRDYDTGYQAGLKLFVLAESHYTNHFDQVREDDLREFTRYIVGPLTMMPKRDNRTFRLLEQVLGGPDVWHRIAFGNLVQAPPLNTARSRPTRDVMRRGARVLTHVLPILRPDLMLVVGKLTWNALDDSGKTYPIDGAVRPDGDRGADARNIYFLRTAEAGLTVPAIHMVHAAARRAFKAEQWAALVRSFVSHIAQEKHRGLERAHSFLRADEPACASGNAAANACRR